MICSRCHADNPPNAAFCDECGAQLETACPNCGEANRRSAKFCRNCGQSISQAATSTAAPIAGIPASETYVPKHLAEKILASRHILEGERKQVTVLFADIRGSTKLIEGLDPEEAQKIIDPVLQVMMDAVHRYEGTVNQVLGDGVMALFGAPLAHEDHALRACYSALAMQEDMRRHRRKLGQSEESGLQIGIGMNSGEVVVRSIDNDLNIEYSALGQTTHLAARMQELAGRGSILMTASTLRQVEGFIQVKSLGAVQAKGISQPVDTFEVVGVTTARTRVQAAVTRGLTPLVGRRAEIEVFNKLVEQAAAGKGQILAMVGEPGMGKSRLVHEFTRHQLRPGWLVLEGASVSFGKATPYLPLVEMLRRYFQIADGEGSEITRDQVVMHIVELDSMLKDAIPPILSLLGALPNESISPPGDQHNSLNGLQELAEMIRRFNSMDPQQRHRYTLEAVKRVLTGESHRQPLLVVFEDLHWVDNATQAFLDSLTDSLPLARILVIVNYRPEYNHGWGEKSYYTQIRVDPLQPTSAEELLQHLLGPNRDLVPLKEMLIQRTEGNPFFAEESVRSLVETGVVVGEKGAFRPGLKIEEIRIPSTVQNVVADRIDRLRTEEKHLLQTAAVIGVIVPLPLLRAVAALPEDELRGYLAHLQASEFLYETKLFPQLEYTFKHALTNEVAYGALLHERRTALHAQIVAAIEKLDAGNLQEKIEQLAHHAYQGELWDKAVTYLKESGLKSVSRSSFRNAMAYFEQGLESLRRLPETRDTLKHGVDLRIEIRNTLYILGDFQQGLRYLEEAQPAAIALNDQGRLGKLCNFMTAHWNLSGDSERAIASGMQALHHTKALEHRDLHIVAHYFLGAAYHSVGRYDQAVNVLERALTLIGSRKQETFGTTGIVSAICQHWLVRCLAQLGEFGQALAYGEEAIHTATQSAHSYSTIYAYYGLGMLYYIQSDFDRAVYMLEQGLEVCRTADIPVLYPLIAASLGSAYAFIRRPDQALTLLQSAIEHPAWMTRMGGQSLRMAWVSEAYFETGRTRESEVYARRGLELSRERKDMGSQAWLLRLLGDIAARHSPLDAGQAEANYREALRLADDRKMRPLEAHCHLGLGYVYANLKNNSEARSELFAAVQLYRNMSMPFWLSRAETALAEAAS
jgi:class 3 adenylate cyclase/tetratricopeptide (TPR) repeat protein